MAIRKFYHDMNEKKQNERKIRESAEKTILKKWLSIGAISLGAGVVKIDFIEWQLQILFLLLLLIFP